MCAGPSYAAAGSCELSVISRPSRTRGAAARAVDLYAVLPGDPLEGVPDERAEVRRDGSPAHRLPPQPPLAGGEPEPDQPVSPGLGTGRVHAEFAQGVAERARDRGRDHLLAVGERVLVGRVLDEQEEHVRVQGDQLRGSRRTPSPPAPGSGRRPAAREQALDHGVRTPRSDGAVEVGLVGEVAVEHRLADACRRSDLGDAGRGPCSSMAATAAATSSARRVSRCASQREFRLSFRCFGSLTMRAMWSTVADKCYWK